MPQKAFYQELIQKEGAEEGARLLRVYFDSLNSASFMPVPRDYPWLEWRKDRFGLYELRAEAYDALSRVGGIPADLHGRWLATFGKNQAKFQASLDPRAGCLMAWASTQSPAVTLAHFDSAVEARDAIVAEMGRAKNSDGGIETYQAIKERLDELQYGSTSMGGHLGKLNQLSAAYRKHASSPVSGIDDLRSNRERYDSAIRSFKMSLTDVLRHRLSNARAIEASIDDGRLRQVDEELSALITNRDLLVSRAQQFATANALDANAAAAIAMATTRQVEDKIAARKGAFAAEALMAGASVGDTSDIVRLWRATRDEDLKRMLAEAIANAFATDVTFWFDSSWQVQD